MNYDREFILDYINNTMNKEQELGFFAELTINDDLRNDFNSFIKINTAMKSSADQSIPPSSVTNSIFGSLGFESPVTDSPKPISNTKSLFSVSHILVGVSSSIISFILLYLLLNVFNSSGISTSNKIDLSNKFKRDIHAVYTDNLLKSNQLSEQSSIEKPKEKIIYKYIYADKPDNLRNSEIEDINIDKKNQYNYLSETQPAITNSINKIRVNNNQSITEITNSDHIYLGAINKMISSDNYSLELKTSVSWNLPKETISPTSFNKLNNLDITALYKFNDYIKAGLNIRQETFYTEYTGYESDGSLYRYRQQPNLTTFSGLIRYTFDKYLFFKPIVQLQAGLNSAGMVLRPTIGFEYQIIPELSFIMGLDYSYFRFSHNNQWFSSNKLGLNYGMMFTF